MSQHDPDYDKIDEELDRTLFEAIFKQDPPEDLEIVKAALGEAFKKAIPEDEQWEELARIRPRKYVEEYREIGMPIPTLEEIDEYIEVSIELEKNLEEIEMPSEETWQEWIRLGEERRKQREKL